MKGRGIQLNNNPSDDGEIFDLKIVPERLSGKIVSGLVVDDTVRQNMALILAAHPGDFKFRPDLGAGLTNALLDDDLLVHRHNIREQLQKDGLKVMELDLFSDRPIKIEAKYG